MFSFFTDSLSPLAIKYIKLLTQSKVLTNQKSWARFDNGSIFLVNWIYNFVEYSNKVINKFLKIVFEIWDKFVYYYSYCFFLKTQPL